MNATRTYTRCKYCRYTLYALSPSGQKRCTNCGKQMVEMNAIQDAQTSIYEEIDALCRRLADLGAVEEATAIRRVIDRMENGL